MPSFLALNVDFVLILLGGLLLLLASASVSLSGQDKAAPWRWFTLFAGLHVLRTALNLAVLEQASHASAQLLESVLLLAAHGCLLEFARSQIQARSLGRWLYAPLLAGLFVTTLAAGPTGLAALNAGIALLAGAATAFLWMRTPGQTGPRVRPLRVGALFLFLHQAVVGLAPLLPAAWLENEISVLLPLVTGLLILGLTASLLVHSWTFEKQRWSPEMVTARRRRRLICGGILALIVLAGWFTADQAGAQQDQMMRRQILARTQIATAAIPPSDVKLLHWDERDLENPAYLRLKALLTGMRHANPDLRFVLLAGLREGRAYFLADSENPASSDYSPPGQSYDEATPAYLAGLASGRAFVLGPETDRWGTWMYGDVPVLDEQGRPLAYLELDIAAADWNALIRHARLPALLITLLISTLVVGSFIALERLRENAALIAESEHRNRSLVEGSPDCVQMFDLAGCCVAVNQNGLRALGRPASRVLGHPIASLWPESSRPAILAAVTTTLAGSPVSLETDYLTPDGRLLTWRVATNPVLDDQGHVSGFAVICVDLTERKQAELALLAAKKAAEEATQAKSDFMAVMSHEIRTPLSGIMGMLDLLYQAPLLPQPRRYTQFARESAESLLHLLDEALDSAKIEAGKLDLEIIPFRPAEYFESVFATIAMRAGAKNLAFHHHVSPAVPPVLLGDPSRLRQVINNLANNALKFTERGQVAITLDAAPLATGDVSFQITVSDTGIGISPENIGRLFSKYAQADSSTTRRFGGTGLGLSIVKSLAELMGGTVSVTSTLGAGSRFVFSGQLAVAAPEAMPRSTVPAPAVAPPAPSPGGLRVLVVDDDAANRTVASALVTNLGHQVELALNGREAVDRLVQESFDLVLMDSRMPVMDGLTATRLIRDPVTRATNPDIYIIALTANASAEDRAQCLAAGMNDFVTKPVRAPVMAAALSRAVQSLSGAKTAPAPANLAVAAPPPGLSADELLASLNETEAAPAAPTLPAGVLEKIIHLFLQESPVRLGALRAAFQQRDPVTFAREVHTLKSNARYLNATALAELAARAEHLADQGSVDSLGPLLAEIEQTHASVCADLRARDAA